MCFTKVIWPSSRKSTSQDRGGVSLTSGTSSGTARIENSKGSKYSSSSASSLAGVREMVSDGAMIFKYAELRRATKNFDSMARIGSSSFRATVRHRDAVIVIKKRRLVTNIFKKLKILCSVHHSSVVKLLGACLSDDEHLFLVYEYVQGLNVRECLRNSKVLGFSVLDSWTKRLQVALELAQGLEYLHDYTHGGFIHKYIKSSNIIVDNDLHLKIAEFGIPYLTGEVEWGDFEETIEVERETDKHQGLETLTRSRSVRLTGTPGYMAPEYISRSSITKKLDVFAFGIVLLELLTGKEPAPTLSRKMNNNISLPEMARIIVTDDQLWTGKLRLWIDPVLKDSYPLKSAFDVVLLAKACVEQDPDSRPDMKDVAVRLSRLLGSFQKWETSMRVARNLQSREMEAR